MEHARDTLTDLLRLLIDHTKPPLVLSKLEGDAVFSYTWGNESFHDGQAFVELIEDTYVAFRRAIELMVMNNTCQCAACANVSNLDLKFLVHHGTFAQQPLGPQTELVGTDVNLIHRLTKNTVTEETGIKAYTLYTDAAVAHLGIEDLSAAMVPHVESYEHLESMNLWVHDMHPLWERRQSEDRVELEPVAIAEGSIGLPPEVVWGYLRQPQFRSVIVGADRVTVDGRKNGRLGPESQFQCFHGNNVLRQVIVEWAPFERIVTQDTETMPVMNKLTWKNEYRLTPDGDATRLRISLNDFEGPTLWRTAAGFMMRRGAGLVEKNIREFAALVEADWARRRALDSEASSMEPTPESIRQAADRELKGG